MTDNESLASAIMSLIPEFDRVFIRPFASMVKDTLTASQMKLLFVLVQEEKVAMSELGKALNVSKPQLTNMADGLVRNGLVERFYEPDDRRKISLRATEKAHQFLQEARKQALDYHEHRLAILTEEEKQRLYEDVLEVRELLLKLR